jgi:hypothetical protein
LEPIVGKPKVPQETCFFMEYCTHFFEGEQDLRDLSGSRWYQEASPYRRGLIELSCAGLCKFANHPIFRPLNEGWERSSIYVAKVASSRRFRIADGVDLRAFGIPSFVSPPRQSVAGMAPNPRGLLASARALLFERGRAHGVEEKPGEAGTG